MTSQTWHFPSRAECIVCHNPWAGFTLAFNPLQLSEEKHSMRNPNFSHCHDLKETGYIDLLRKRNGKDSPGTGHQITLVYSRCSWGVRRPDRGLRSGRRDGGISGTPELLEDSARSYLHAKLRPLSSTGARGGTADFDLAHHDLGGKDQVGRDPGGPRHFRYSRRAHHRSRRPLSFQHSTIACQSSAAARHAPYRFRRGRSGRACTSLPMDK